MNNKEQAVYEAIGRMCENGLDLSVIKVADIAKEAGIGKGTVYEYFGTKEEILGKALVYNMDIQEETLRLGVESVTSFSDKFGAVLRWIENNSKVRYWILHFLTTNQQANNIGEWIRNSRQCTLEECDRYMEIIGRIIVKGVEEGIIKEPANRLVRDTAVSSAAAAILSYLSHPERYAECTLEEVEEYTKNILITVINTL